MTATVAVDFDDWDDALHWEHLLRKADIELLDRGMEGEGPVVEWRLDLNARAPQPDITTDLARLMVNHGATLAAAAINMESDLGGEAFGFVVTEPIPAEDRARQVRVLASIAALIETLRTAAAQVLGVAPIAIPLPPAKAH